MAISFALPTFAQEKQTVDPQLIQKLDTISKKYNEAINNYDAAAIGALYTDDAIFVTDTGFLYDRQTIEKFYADNFKGWQPKNHTSTMDPHSVRMLGPDNVSGPHELGLDGSLYLPERSVDLSGDVDNGSFSVRGLGTIQEPIWSLIPPVPK
ncbi:MAG: nuclear transport factor 2 family protein [Verrucomicrobia bacterium]|nr:nuclear transport factor 2 family protein [Verrucomicrobiota bacterium]